MKNIKFVVPGIPVIALVVLVILLKTYQEPPVPETRRFVARVNLQPLTLVNAANLEPRSPDENLPDITKLLNRYLLVSVDKDKEVRDEMLAPQAATELLSDAVAVSVPASPTTVVGNQLRTGDLVDVVAAPLVPGAGVKKFENLMVLLPATATSGTIVLAVPGTQRDDFASALVGTQLLISRKIVTIKPQLG
jgi:hypothetical protein